ncbi:hypothetical protein Vretimale_8880, partial [Volvox reticuliferus]
GGDGGLGGGESAPPSITSTSSLAALEVIVFTKPTVAAPLPTIFDVGPISASKAAKPTASASGAKTPPPCPRDAPGTWAAEAASGGGEGGDRGGNGDGGEGGGEGD